VSLYLDNGLQPLIMKPGELVQVSNNRNMEVLRRKVNPEVYSAWKDNQFVFDNTSIGEIAAIIESNFGYQVQFADSTIKNKKMTLKVLNRDLNLLLTALAEAHDLKISRKDGRILIEDNSFSK
jgi:transmembrane sensor